jgi:hypothetical protein
MRRTQTFAWLQEEVRQRYDLANYSTTTWSTTTSIKSMANSSLQAYYALLTECYGDNYFAKNATLTTTAGQATTDLPTDFAKLKALVWQRGTDDPVMLKRAQRSDEYLIGMSSQGWSTWEPKYELFGLTTVRWYPKPNDVYSVLIDYIYTPADLSGDSDTFPAGQGWEDWVVLDICRKLAARDDKDPGVFLAELQDIERRVRAQAPERDEGEARTLRDATYHGESAYSRRNRLTQDW